MPEKAYPPLDYNKYKPLLIDSTGRRLTAGLFEELADPASSIKPVFKLSDWRRIYVDICDPTDYKAALALIGDWEHWQWLLKQCRMFAEYVESWRAEVDVKLASEGLTQLRKQAKDVKGTAAAKWLVERGAMPKRGRPIKEKTPEESRDILHDFRRIGGGS